MTHFTLLAVIYAAFISLGLPDGVLGVAWPGMRAGLGQALEAAGLVTLILTLCSAISGFASGYVLQRLGTGRVVSISGWMTGLALLGFSLAPSFGWILWLTIPLGLGAGAVDAGLNHFVARHYDARHMNWLHACWGIGATVGPFVMGAALLGDAGWRGGYQTIALMQMALALVFVLSLRLWQREPVRSETSGPDVPGSARKRDVPPWAPWLAAMLYFVYTAIELGTGLWAASILVDGRGMEPAAAGFRVSCFFGSIMLGRFAIGLIAARVGNRALVRHGITLAAVGAVLFSLPWFPEVLSLPALILLGLGCAPIYPSLMHEATRRFDADLARRVIGRQVAFAYLGCATGPAALGLLGAWWGLWTIMPAIALALALLLFMVRRLDRVT